MYHPVFVILNNTDTSQFTSSWGSWRRPWPIGATIEIWVDPSNAERSEINCFASMYGISSTLFGLSGISAIVLYVVTHFNWSLNSP